MKRLVGIACCLFLLLASAAWALEKCQSLVAHHGMHAHLDEMPHADSRGAEPDYSHPAANDQTIHCPDSSVKLAFIISPPPRISPLVTARQFLHSSICFAVAENIVSTIRSEHRPPGSLFSAVSQYLALSVLRI